MPKKRKRTKSDMWIEQWNDERKKYIRLKKPLKKLDDRIKRHKASLVLGRNFGETLNAYLKRKGLRKYWDWGLKKKK